MPLSRGPTTIIFMQRRLELIDLSLKVTNWIFAIFYFKWLQTYVLVSLKSKCLFQISINLYFSLFIISSEAEIRVNLYMFYGRGLSRDDPRGAGLEHRLLSLLLS